MNGRKAQTRGKRREVAAAGDTATPNTRLWTAAAVAAVVLLAGGWGHRGLVARIALAVGEVAELSRPLTSLPLELGGWYGHEIPMGDIPSRVAWFDDEYVNRVYVNRATGSRVVVFVGYVGHPRAHFGHRPDVCFAAHGAEQVASDALVVELPDGGRVPAFLYEFRAPGMLEERTLVLATYLINGRYTADPDELRRFNARNPGLMGERTAYLTRVQVSIRASSDRGADVAALRDLAARMQGPIISSMPYVHG